MRSVMATEPIPINLCIISKYDSEMMDKINTSRSGRILPSLSVAYKVAVVHRRRRTGREAHRSPLCGNGYFVVSCQ